LLNHGLQMNDLQTEFPAYPKLKLQELQFLKEQLYLLYNVILSVTKNPQLFTTRFFSRISITQNSLQNDN
jgi:hypothetical protein